MLIGYQPDPHGALVVRMCPSQLKDENGSPIMALVVRVVENGEDWSQPSEWNDWIAATVAVMWSETRVMTLKLFCSGVERPQHVHNQVSVCLLSSPQSGCFQHLSRASPGLVLVTHPRIPFISGNPGSLDGRNTTRWRKWWSSRRKVDVYIS
jgi:hypothetical protein